MRLRTYPSPRISASPSDSCLHRRRDSFQRLGVGRQGRLTLANLEALLIAEGIDITGEPTLNQYNPPWTLPFLRRNEIIVPVAVTEAALN